MQNVQVRDSFFSILMMFWRRENYLNYPVLVFHGEGARDGIASLGSLLGTLALSQAVWSKQVWGRYSSSMPFGPYQAAALGGKKKAETAIPFQPVGVSHHWVTASTLVGGTGSHQPTCGYPELFLSTSPPAFFFVFLHLVLQWKKQRGAPTRTPFWARQGRYDIWLEPHSQRGDLLTFAFSQGAHHTVNLFVTNSGDLRGRSKGNTLNTWLMLKAR